jgi:hypothetical protein
LRNGVVADSYVMAGGERTIQVLGPTFVQDVQYQGAKTKPSGVYFAFPIPIPQWKADSGDSILGTIASQIEQMISEKLAVGGEYVNTTDANGLLADYMDFIVEYTPPNGFQPPLSTRVRIPLDALLASIDPFFTGLPGSPVSLLSAAYDQLAAAAAQ